MHLRLKIGKNKTDIARQSKYVHRFRVLQVFLLQLLTQRKYFIEVYKIFKGPHSRVHAILELFSPMISIVASQYHTVVFFSETILEQSPRNSSLKKRHLLVYANQNGAKEKLNCLFLPKTAALLSMCLVLNFRVIQLKRSSHK